MAASKNATKSTTSKPAPAKAEAAKPAKVVEHKPTIKWVDSIVARKKAAGKMTATELKEYRDKLVAKHGLAA